MRVIATNIDGPSAAIPMDGVIQISFDRYILPSTVTRQSYLIVDSNNQPLTGLPLQTIYDPIARTVTIAGPDGAGRPWLTENGSYKLLLPVAPDPATDIGGFRAIDRAPLLAEQNRERVFRAGPADGKTDYEAISVDFCADVFPIFAAKCNDPSCHGGFEGTTADRTAASLILGTANGIRVTAIGRVAQGANVGARSYLPDPPGRVFGLNMAIIQPHDPGSSWLMYKLELAKHPTVEPDGGIKETVCTPPDGSTPPTAAPTFKTLANIQAQADDIELGVLRDFVLGREMPYPEQRPLTFQEREMVRIWIARGAETRDCGGCGER